MSCSTAYLVRDHDGIWRTRWEKYGLWRILAQSQLDAVLAEVRKHDCRLEQGSSQWWSGWLCRGVLIDLVTRRLRFHACQSEILRPDVGWMESMERAFARAAVWRGWELGYAWGGRDEFVSLVPEAAAAIEPELVESRSIEQLPDALLQHTDLIAWDRASLRLHLRHLPWSQYGGVLSVIDERLEVLDYGFAWCDGVVVLPWLTHGPRLLDALEPAVPYPLPHEEEVDQGVVIDCAARTIRHWSAESTLPALLAAIADAWPGWQIERLRFGFAGQLAATGRREESLLIADAELPTRNQWDQPLFDAQWLAERSALVPDPRRLRCIELALDDD